MIKSDVKYLLFIFCGIKWQHFQDFSLDGACVFGSVVAGTFQITFRAKIHVNDVFSFFKNHF
jgi:hypothetical protein